MTSGDTLSGATGAREIVDEEATGVDRPGLHASGGARPLNETFGDVLARNMARRSFLAGAGASVPVLMTASLLPDWAGEAEANAGPGGLGFSPIRPSTLDRVVTPENYEANVIIRWGDAMFVDAPEFDVRNQTAAAQAGQFGFNCDFVGFFPLEGENRALLCVNHEYTSGADMFVAYRPGADKEQADVEIMAHGGAVVEIVRERGAWTYVRGGAYNRRITGATAMEITGPAVGHPLMRTGEDPAGRTVLGMLNNCSGGKTPWGTWLSCEENFNQYFAHNARLPDGEAKAAHARYGVSGGATERRWETFYDRYDLTKEPNEPFRFGWVVEIDPYDPTFTPKKRTALGRAKHEAATCALAQDGRVVVYTGDDQQFDYVYKFVSNGRYDAGRRENNFGLLDDGALYVARLNDDNTGEWLELSMRNPILASRFSSDGDILIKTRLAADAVGATAMDRPEDCQPNPASGKVYLTMTNNSARSSIRPNAGEAAANPRAPNFNGHIIEVAEHGDDHGALTFRWEIFLLCGDPAIDLKTDASLLGPGLAPGATFFAGYADASRLGKVASPDNIAFDSVGNLWIATDGQPSSADIGRPNDAIHVVPTAGRERGYLRQFLSGPRGCEVCGPEFSADDRTLFAAIQHPGEGGGVPNAVSGWPDSAPIARPSVIGVRHVDGRRIGEA